MTEAKKKKLERCRKRLDMYYAAEEAVLLGQEYRIASRSLKRADLAAIRSAIEGLETQIEDLESAGGKRHAGRFLPRDV